MDWGGGKRRRTAQEKQLLEYTGKWHYWLYRTLIIKQLNDQEESLGDKSEDTMVYSHRHINQSKETSMCKNSETEVRDVWFMR